MHLGSCSSSTMLSSISSHSLLVQSGAVTNPTASTSDMQSQRSVCNDRSSSHQSKRLSTPSLDAFNSAHIVNLKDIQTYILRRLDSDQALKARFSRLNKQNSIELLNLLLLKSNYSILYVEKCFDLIIAQTTDNCGHFLAPDDIKNIPAHLNGLYLFVLEKILADLHTRFDEPLRIASGLNLKDILYTIFSVGLLEFRPFRRDSVFEKTKFRYIDKSFFCNKYIPISSYNSH